MGSPTCPFVTVRNAGHDASLATLRKDDKTIKWLTKDRQTKKNHTSHIDYETFFRFTEYNIHEICQMWKCSHPKKRKIPQNKNKIVSINKLNVYQYHQE